MTIQDVKTGVWYALGQLLALYFMQIQLILGRQTLQVNQQPSLYDINTAADQVGKDGNSPQRVYVAKRPCLATN